jgi:uncharacterized protein (DUF2062 family)
MKYLAKLKDYIIRLSKKGLSPKEIALGVAMGNLIGFIPVPGTHTVMAIFLASIFRLNTLIVLLGTQISNPVSYPLQIFFSAQIGNLFLHGEFLTITFAGGISYLEYYIVPIILGSLILGITVSGLSYLLVNSFLQRKQRLS